MGVDVRQEYVCCITPPSLSLAMAEFQTKAHGSFVTYSSARRLSAAISRISLDLQSEPRSFTQCIADSHDFPRIFTSVRHSNSNMTHVLLRCATVALIDGSCDVAVPFSVGGNCKQTLSGKCSIPSTRPRDIKLG
jgi:hypothetical protein